MAKKTINSCLTLTLALFSYKALAHSAHEHGVAKVDIGVQEKTATIHLEVPANSIYGFEHAAKSEKDKKAVHAAIEKMKINFPEMVKLDPSLGCSYSASKIEPFIIDPDDDDDDEVNIAHEKSKVKKKQGQHGEVHAEFSVKCAKEIAGSKITFGFKKYFPNIHKINVQGLSDKSQAGAKISDDKGFLQL